MKFFRSLDVVGLSDVGRHRTRNEDAIDFDVSRGIMVLADGMGGHQAGDVASELAVLSILADLKHTLRKRFRFKRMLAERVKPKSFQATPQPQDYEAQKLLSAVQSANSLIYQISQNQAQFSGMGTTLLVSVFTKNKLHVGHVGDSRMYRHRQQMLEQLTEDHSIVQAQINAGWLPPEYAKISANKNLVTRALGLDEDVDLTLNSFDVALGDKYLLCSDGLTDAVQDTQILAILNRPNKIECLAQELVKLANKQGGKDNISVILIEVRNRFFSRDRRKNTVRLSSRQPNGLIHWMKQIF